MPKSVVWFERLWFASFGVALAARAISTITSNGNIDSVAATDGLVRLFTLQLILGCLVLLVSRKRWQWIAVILAIWVIVYIWMETLQFVYRPWAPYRIPRFIVSYIYIVLQGAGVVQLMGPSARQYFSRGGAVAHEEPDAAGK